MLGYVPRDVDERIGSAAGGSRRPAPERDCAPMIGVPPGDTVTVPDTVPFPIAVQLGNLNEPIRVKSFSPSVA